MIKLQVLTLLLFSHFAMAQVSLRYEGYIENSGVPVNASSQNFNIQIMNAICATPLITSNTSADIVDGEFNVAPSFADATLFAQVMNPSYTNGSCPTPSPNRVFRIVWNSQTFDIAMNDAARAAFSNSTARLSDRTQDQFLKIDSYAAQPTITNAQVNTLIDLIAGTNTQYLRPSSAFSGDVSGTASALVVQGLRGNPISATTPTVGQVLKYNGTNWAPAVDDSGSTPGDASYATKGLVQVSSDEATSGLNITTGVLSLSNLGTAGTYGSSTQIPVMTVDNKGRVTGVANTLMAALPLAGGNMTGAINMTNNNILNVSSIAATNFSGRNLILNDNDVSNTITLRTPFDVTTSYSLTLPPDDGAAGQVLSTDGAGLLSWVTNGGGGGGTVTSVSSINSYLSVTAATTAPVITANVGTTPNTLAAGNDPRIINALQVDGDSRGTNITIGTNDSYGLSLETSGLPRLNINPAGQVGIGVPTPNAALDVSGSLNMRGFSFQPSSNPSEGRIYFDNTINRFRVSENGGSYQDLISMESYGLGAGQVPRVANAMTANGVVVSNATATGLTAINCTTNQVIKFDVSGFATCGTDNSGPANAFTDGGNTFAANATIGTNDNFSLSFETNNTVQMRVLAGGNIEHYRALDTLASTGHALAPVNQGRIYFNTSDNKYKVSQNGSDYQDLVSVRFPVDNSPGASIAVGNNALQYQTGAVARSNIAIGFQSMSSPTMNTGAVNNIAIGRSTLSALTNGSYNVAIGSGDGGVFPLGQTTTGQGNVAIGAGAAGQSTTGSSNTAIGRSAMAGNMNGQENTFVGAQAGANSAGSSDTAVGSGALMNSVMGYNSALGDSALRSITGGEDNVGIGADTGYNITTGSNNLLLGTAVGATILTTGNNNILIGTSDAVDTPTPNSSNHLNIGNAIYGNLATGNIGIGTNAPSTRLDVNGTVRLGNGSSTMSRMIFCNPSVTVGAALVAAGDSINIQSAGSSCPGIQSGMVVNCSWGSESSPLSRLSWTTIVTNSTDETNQAIRIRFTNQAMSGTLPAASSTLALACVAYRP